MGNLAYAEVPEVATAVPGGDKYKSSSNYQLCQELDALAADTKAATMR